MEFLQKDLFIYLNLYFICFDGVAFYRFQVYIFNKVTFYKSKF